MYTKDDIYDKRPMKKGKKRHWSFTCPSCKQKFNSESHTEYYVWLDELLGEIDSPHFLLCSKECIDKMVIKQGIDLDKIL